VVLSPESVMSVIEVKTKIVPGKSFLDNSIENIRSVRKLNSRISGLIFGYRGSSPVNIMNELTEYYRNSKVPLKEIFELMVNINMGYCIIPKRVDNSETLFNLDTSLNQVDTEFVFHVLNTAKKNVKDHVNSPPLGSLHFPTFGREGLDGFGLNFFRYDSPSMTK
jgi:hypothetical protein